MRIAIVNDMLLAVEATRRALLRMGEHEVVWVARNGVEAVAHCKRDRPDLILMDLFMPEMDGVEATRQIMAATPCAIVVVTGNVKDHAGKVFDAMGAGALDAVNTPTFGSRSDEAEARALLAKVETIRRWIESSRAGKVIESHTPVLQRNESASGCLVVIGASAGGPAALAKVLARLPADFPASVAIVQHVDVQFASGLATWLGAHTPLAVRLVEEGNAPEAGTVVIAGRQFHLALTPARRWVYLREPSDSIHRPSVDVLFESVSQNWRGMAVGVLLTGMGRDGAAGLLALRRRGHLTIAQDEATSAVYGMPKAAVELNAAVEILALDKIGARLTNIVVAKLEPHARRTH